MPSVTSRSIVRTGIAQFFGGPVYDQDFRAYRGAIPGNLGAAGLSTVRAYRPKRLNDNDYVLSQAAGRGMGAYMFIELPNDTEIRRALPAAGPGTNYILAGRRRITYNVILHVYHLAHKAYAEDAEADADALLEEIKSKIRSDVTLGGICYQAGEGPPGIRTRVFPSVTDDKEITGTYSTVTFNAEVEIIS